MIYGASGGVAEAVARHCLPDKSKNTLRTLEFSPLRGNEAVRECTLQVGDVEIKIAIVHGLINAQNLIREIEEGKAFYHLIEVMTCVGGCVGGAGQPYGRKTVKDQRRDGLYQADKSAPFKRAEYNPGAVSLLNSMGEHEKHHLLHVSYVEE